VPRHGTDVEVLMARGHRTFRDPIGSQKFQDFFSGENAGGFSGSFLMVLYGKYMEIWLEIDVLFWKNHGKYMDNILKFRSLDDFFQWIIWTNIKLLGFDVRSFYT
jgi:hypothetical protein